MREKALLYWIYSQDPQAEMPAPLRGDMTQKKADLLQEESKQQHSKHSRKEEQPEIVLDHYEQNEQNHILKNKAFNKKFSKQCHRRTILGSQENLSANSS